MAAKTVLLSLVYTFLFAALIIHCHCSEKKVHIVYMGDRPQGGSPAIAFHHSMLQSVLGSASLAKESLVHSYGRSFDGFAAKLTDEEAARFLEMEGVVSVMPNRILNLHTTRSWDFMGFSQGGNRLPQEGDVIIGILDTGIWPESESFSDMGMSPPPAKWKGTCQVANFTCNKKVIGARFYNSFKLYIEGEIKSPRDIEGHGSHTASTAAGNVVNGANYFGMAEGIARGGSPGSRIAVYKVCWAFGCTDADILAAFDDAIADGVDIISVSIGSPFASPYMEDSLAIGAYHAMKHGILTSMSAGNAGPAPYSVSNVAPWMLTVAANTIDRKFISKVVIGNGDVYMGVSINNFVLNGTSYPLIWGGDAVNYSAGSYMDFSSECFFGTLNSYKAARKIVFCEVLHDGSSVLVADGVGTIMADSAPMDYAFNFPLPATHISSEDGAKILSYIRSTENPIATILAGETLIDIMAPYVVSFSSRGPNAVTPDILKPDITAPGVDILAAWSPLASPSSYYDDPRKVNYNIISGTSMSCPHVTGAAAYVKAMHPDWSPSAIKSALMTTAFVMDPNKHMELEFAYGSGHVNPTTAINPGLIYDASEADYISFLCKQGYNTTTLRMITGSNSSFCSSNTPGRAWELNYPTFALAIEDGQPISGVFTRTVTNVGFANSTYTLSLYMPYPITITVDPTVLSFSAVGQTKSYTVKVNGPKIVQQPIMSGSITWKDGTHVVRSPLVVYTVLPGATSNFMTSNSVDQKASKFSSSLLHKLGH